MNLNKIIKNIGINAKEASVKMANTNNEKKNDALDNLRQDLKLFSSELIKINKKDLDNAHLMKLSSSMIDRLTLNEDRIDNMIKSLKEIINLKDPVGIIL